MSVPALSRLLWEPVVRASLLEDLGAGGDVTSQALMRPGQVLRASFRAREPGVVAGLDGACLSFTLLDPQVHFTSHKADGERIVPGDILAVVEGRAETVLSGERTALNLLSHLSGIASVTRRVADAISGTGARVCCTRKTLPGLRAVQKYAVRAGGGSNHRYRLDDAILIKDNHIALAGGNVETALAAARERAGHLMSIELEVDTLTQLEAALACGGADAFLLDNMTPEELREAVRMVDGRAVTEASGGITPETARSVAESGVDVLSLGWLTHSVRALDIGLDIV
ncbi:carboxylating nicotinate-nucleotide diphosphorylase [Acetobacter sp. AN02]|uniref:carboxylating nicotinate-nucleotide diphosphorylase n=1 Tax=Acetobacter sp. AN02 TaxID=2894186 RepID=UPI00243427AA|nr:carboxylating nicotinate-nucleotide diphosphorylase [Acetobacter sp. AN02]MDG6095188.1 carboxylating nicotinate-nucleotide diphosphorylase [Acetobacter sp. AN02]